MPTVGYKSSILMLSAGQRDDDPMHLFVALNNPYDYGIKNLKDCTMLVNFTSYSHNTDQVQLDGSHVFMPGCHEFIKQPSYILYKKAEIQSVIFVENGISSGRFSAREIVNHDVYINILKGIFKSRQIKSGYRGYIRNAINDGACPGVDMEMINSVE